MTRRNRGIRGHETTSAGGAASINPTSAAKSARARSASRRRLMSSSWLSVKSNTQISAAPDGDTAGSASAPRSAILLPVPGGVTAMRKGGGCLLRSPHEAGQLRDLILSEPRPGIIRQLAEIAGHLVQTPASPPACPTPLSGHPHAPAAEWLALLPASVPSDGQKPAPRPRRQRWLLALIISQAALAVHNASNRPMSTRVIGEMSIGRALFPVSQTCKVYAAGSRPSRARRDRRCVQADFQSSVTIMLRLERTFDGYTDVVGLLLAQFCKLHTQFVEMQRCHLFVEMLGEDIDIVFIGTRVLP